MDYGCVVPARFLARPNRFIARVRLGEQTVECHVKNTGRCRELLVPGATVYLERGTNPNRRTAWDLIAADKGGKLINMDAQAPTGCSPNGPGSAGPMSAPRCGTAGPGWTSAWTAITWWR